MVCNKLMSNSTLYCDGPQLTLLWGYVIYLVGNQTSSTYLLYLLLSLTCIFINQHCKKMWISFLLFWKVLVYKDSCSLTGVYIGKLKQCIAFLFVLIRLSKNPFYIIDLSFQTVFICMSWNISYLIRFYCKNRKNHVLRT